MPKFAIYHKKTIRILLILTAWTFIFGQTTARAQYQIESWTTDRGLPQNTVYSVAKTPDGYLWLATLDGLVRFDGVRFTVFNKQNSAGINSNRFTQLVVDGQGALWAGTESDGITRFRDGKFQTFPLAADSHGRPLWKLFLNGAGELVVFTQTEMLRWNGEQFVSSPPVAGETPESIALWGKSGTFWYADTDTIYRFKNTRTDKFPLLGMAKYPIINNLFEDSRGRLWIGTSHSGLFLLENERLAAFPLEVPLLNNYVSPRIEDSRGNLWIVTNTGIVIISADGKTSRLTTEQGLSGDSTAAIFAFNSVYEDREGNIWVGTLYSGLNRLSRQSLTFYSKKDGLAGDAVNPIYQSETGDIWIGGKSLSYYRAGVFTPVTGWRELSSATAIEQDRSRRIWFGRWDGLFYYENGVFTNFNELQIFNQKLNLRASITDIHEDRDGTKWFASSVGVFRYRVDEPEPITRLTTENGLASNDVKIIHESPDGALWFGTYGGLTRFKNGVFTSLTTGDGLASNLVRSLYEDAENVLWIGSYDGGLTRLKNGKLTSYTTKDGLFNDGVFQILEDARGNFWMSCNRGIYRVAKQQLNDFADGKISRINSIALGKADGLLETECNGGQQPSGMKARDGKLWFPTQRGVAVIDPEKIASNPQPPPVIIEAVKVDGENFDLKETIEIAPGKNNLEIDYTGLSFIKPEFVKFRYRLEGLQNDWIEADGRRTAYFSYLPPGEYTFQVIAANADGVWNTEGKRLKIVVRPPFYRTWWFWVLAALLIVGIAYLFYRRRIARLEKSRTAQENFSRQLLASQERERQRIASELHDSIGQSLLIIKNRAFLALSDLGEPEIVKEQLEELSASATEAIEECREISYNLRPYQIKRFGLTKTLEAIFKRISEVTEIETTIEIDAIDNVFSAEAETNIYRVVQESVNNIIKHSAASAAELTVEKNGETVDISIRDDGRGFDKNAAQTNDDSRGGFGLVGIAERVRMLGGSYEIESQVGNGTGIKIKLRISNYELRNEVA